MKFLVLISASLILSGCGKLADNISTASQGYVVRCIDGTPYVIISTERGQAITPHLGYDGKPKECKN